MAATTVISALRMNWNAEKRYIYEIQSIGDEDAMPDAILLSPTPQPQYEEEEQTI